MICFCLCEDCSLLPCGEISWSLRPSNLRKSVGYCRPAPWLIKLGESPGEICMGEEFRSHHIISSLASNFLSKCYAPILWPQEGLKIQGGFENNIKRSCIEPGHANFKTMLQENKKSSHAHIYYLVWSSFRMCPSNVLNINTWMFINIFCKSCGAHHHWSSCWKVRVL